MGLDFSVSLEMLHHSLRLVQLGSDGSSLQVLFLQAFPLGSLEGQAGPFLQERMPAWLMQCEAAHHLCSASPHCFSFASSADAARGEGGFGNQQERPFPGENVQKVGEPWQREVSADAFCIVC